MRPVLAPIWRRIEPFVERATPPDAAAQAMRAELAKARGAKRALGPDAPIRPINQSEYAAMAAEYPYYKNRWSYQSMAGALAEDLIIRRDLQTALELGPHLRPLIVGADAMVLHEQSDLRHEGRVIEHDATVAPWPVADKSYDLFVALQVFEHLVGRQDEAFAEVRRAARNAIISLPIDWKMKDPNNCHNMISEERAMSWFAPVVPTRIVLGNGGAYKRLIFVFEDLPA
jgi:hypothetical protein